MTDPGLAYQTAAVAALRTALTSAGYSDVNQRVVVNPDDAYGLPYVVTGQDTAINWESHTNDGAEITATFTCWADDPDEARTVARTITTTLTDRTAPLSVTGFTLGPYTLDFRGGLLRDDMGDDTYWGVPVRVRAYLRED